jgi:hypothetical protein
MKDWRGTEIEVGATVVYPGRGGSSLWMTEGTVVALHSETEDRWDWRAKARVPTEVGTVEVKRTRVQSWREITDPDKTYKIKVSNVVVIA